LLRLSPPALSTALNRLALTYIKRPDSLVRSL
jgi:hypothetical protein